MTKRYKNILTLLSLSLLLQVLLVLNNTRNVRIL